MSSGAKKTTKTKSRAKRRAYHVGDLHAALLEAGERVLRTEGVAGLGIRAVTREAGVSHTAAKPHFGDLAGFRAELAAVGFNRLADALEAKSSIANVRGRRLALARAYLHFASAHPPLFNLMFRYEMVDMTQPALVEASARAIRALAGPMGGRPAAEELPREVAIRMAAGWSLVHGLSVLVVDKRLRGVQKRAPTFATLMELAEAVLESVTLEVES